MQIYSGNHNKVAKSDSTYIREFHPGMKKTVARNIKRVVRQEGRAECVNYLNGYEVTTAEKQYFQDQEFEDRIAESLMESYRNDPYYDSYFEDHDEFSDYYVDDFWFHEKD